MSLRKKSEKKIKVGFVTDDIDRRAMGTALYMQKLIEEFTANYSEEIELVLIHREGKCTVPVCRLARNLPIPTFKFKKYSGFFSFLRFFFTQKEEFDIIHFPRPKLFPFFWKLRAKKIVVTFHDAPEKGSKRFRTWHNYVFEWFIKLWGARHIDAALGASLYSAQTIFQYYRTDPAKTYGIQNGKEEAFFPLDAKQKKQGIKTLQEKYNVPFPYILQSTRLVPHKNPHRTILGFGLLKQKYTVPHKLVIMGGGANNAPSFQKVVKKAIEDCGVKDDIFIAPFIDDEDLNIFFNCADVFIQVGTSDGFSIPIANALAAGIPVVTSNVSCFPEMVGESGFLANPHDPSDIAEKLHVAISDEKKRREVVEKGLEYAKRFDWTRTAGEILGVYRKILAQEDVRVEDISREPKIVSLQKDHTLDEIHTEQNFNEYVRAVNTVFHDIEGEGYENVHPEIMEREVLRWKELGEEYFFNLPRTARVLDIGSGTGFVYRFVAPFLREGDVFTFSDVSQKMLDHCRESYMRNESQKGEERKAHLEFIKLSEDELPFEKNSFDVVTLNSVLHHIPDVPKGLSEVERIVRPGGILIIAHEPNASFFKNKVLWTNYKLWRILTDGRAFLESIAKHTGLARPYNFIYSKFYPKKADSYREKLVREVNEKLQKDGIIQAPLSSGELGSIVDIWSRSGFDVDEIVEKYFSKYEVLESETYDHLHKVIMEKPGPVSRRVDGFFAKMYPRDGRTFTLVLKKKK